MFLPNKTGYHVIKGDLTACEFCFEKTHIYVYLPPLHFFLEELTKQFIFVAMFLQVVSNSLVVLFHLPLLDTGTGLASPPLQRTLPVNMETDNGSETRNQVKQNNLV